MFEPQVKRVSQNSQSKVHIRYILGYTPVDVLVAEARELTGPAISQVMKLREHGKVSSFLS